MNIDEYIKRMQEATDRDVEKMVETDKKMPERQVPFEPTDIYQQNQNHLRSVSSKSFPKGSSIIVNTAVNAVLDGMGGEGLARAYKRAQGDVDALKDQGERGRAMVRRKQYMEEDFLPAVEIVVNSTSPDEVLANKKALDELDKYVLLEGAGKGYTATYIRQAYGNQLGQQTGRSDASVRSGVMRLNALLDDGQIRTAVGLAGDLKKKIDSGSAMADDLDYEMISRVVAYYK